MNDVKILAWGFIFSACGIILGWTLNQVSSWFRTRKEDQKCLKEVLFNLLEAYYIFVRSDFEGIVAKVSDRVLEKLPEEQRTEEGRAFLNSMYGNIIKQFILPDLLAEIKEVQISYQNSIKALASIDPIQAYYLSGKSSIIDRFNRIEQMCEQMEIPVEDEAGIIQSSAKEALNVLKPELTTTLLDDLEDDIKSIAWKINPVVWWRSRKAIRRIKKNAQNDVDEIISNLFNKLEGMFPKQ